MKGINETLNYYVNNFLKYNTNELYDKLQDYSFVIPLLYNNYLL